MKIVFIQTGGTIDKDYPQDATNHGYKFEIAEPAFDPILKRAKPDFEYEVLSVLKKDSLDITDEDRKKSLTQLMV
jgi:L-asparaginase